MAKCVNCKKDDTYPEDYAATFKDGYWCVSCTANNTSIEEEPSIDKAMSSKMDGYSAPSDLLKPSVMHIESGRTLAPENKSIESFDEDIMRCLDIFVEDYGLVPETIAFEIVICGCSSGRAGRILDKWMKRRGI